MTTFYFVCCLISAAVFAEGVSVNSKLIMAVSAIGFTLSAPFALGLWT